MRNGNFFQKVFVAVCSHPLLLACREAAENPREVCDQVVEDYRARVPLYCPAGCHRIILVQLSQLALIRLGQTTCFCIAISIAFLIEVLHYKVILAVVLKDEDYDVADGLN